MRVSGSDLRLLKVFESVVRNNGFAAAEHELNIGQSTISNHMTALEERLGFVLCQRGRGGFRLTEKGRAVYEASRQLGKALDDFSSDVASVRGELKGELRIGMLDAVADDPNNRLSDAIAAYGRIAPEVKIALIQERPLDLQQKVADGQYHCAIGSFQKRIDGLDHEWLYDEWHCCYCGQGHPLFDAPGGEITLEALEAAAFVHRGYWRDEDAFRHVAWRVAATVFQIEPQLLLIRSGRFIGYLPRHYAVRGEAAGELRALMPELLSHSCPFDLVMPTRGRRSDIAVTFADCVREAWRTPTGASASTMTATGQAPARALGKGVGEAA
ncbi:LysR family transcriptional regulator [Aureimonas mangrovi]|uniref:LysR family transcriptional regulator n=1 Tax=Aureimonas mangrovi TaxID=2758041 RepID=UPI00163D7C74|nr:LysR family transcriptional regulator [Aureimonas mangrovi]